MKRTVLSILVALLLIPAFAFALVAKPVLQKYSTAKVIKVADSYTYVREKTNHNDAPEIDKFLAYVGLPKGLPYCLAFDVFIWGQVHKKNPYPKIGGTIRMIEFAKEHPLRYKIYTASDLKRIKGKTLQGYIGIYQHTSSTGHAFIFNNLLSADSFTTIEANTVGKSTKNLAEQRGQGKTKNKQGVYHRTRSSKSVVGQIFKGIIVPI